MVLSEHRGTAGAGASVLTEYPTSCSRRFLVPPFRALWLEHLPEHVQHGRGRMAIDPAQLLDEP